MAHAFMVWTKAGGRRVEGRVDGTTVKHGEEHMVAAQVNRPLKL